MNHLCAAPFVKICGHHATAVAPIALPVDHNAGRALAKAVNVCLCAGIVFRVFMYLCIVVVVVLFLLLLHVAPRNAQQEWNCNAWQRGATTIRRKMWNTPTTCVKCCIQIGAQPQFTAFYDFFLPASNRRSSMTTAYHSFLHTFHIICLCTFKCHQHFFIAPALTATLSNKKFSLNVKFVQLPFFFIYTSSSSYIYIYT